LLIFGIFILNLARDFGVNVTDEYENSKQASQMQPRKGMIIFAVG
jgi:hypothetical protein